MKHVERAWYAVDEQSPVLEHPVFKIAKGRKQGELIFGDRFILVSERVKQALEQEKVSGIRFHAAEIQGIEDTYHLLVFTSKSGCYLDKQKPNGEKEFPLSGWDGSDFTVPDTTAVYLCTRRVVDIFARYRFIGDQKFEYVGRGV